MRKQLRLTRLAVSLLVAFAAPIAMQAQAPADYGPVSADVAEIPYPHPVSTFAFVLYGKDVRMNYMDVKPTGTPNGQTVVLLHGFNFFGEAWAGTIDVLTREGFRVIVPDQIGFGRSSKPPIPYTFNDMAHNTRRLLQSLGIERAVIATKIDKLSRAERVKNLRELERQLGKAALPLSAASGEGLDDLWTLIARLSR
jgi:poly(3-hydroxybutyrate) depolymerase